MSREQRTGGAVELHDDGLVPQRVAGRAIEDLLAQDIGNESALERSAPLYIAGDIHISTRGVVGLVLVDPRPEDRLMSYNPSDEMSYGHVYCVDPEEIGYEDPVRLDPVWMARHIDTSNGFKAIRLYLIPRALTNFMEGRSGLNEAILEEGLNGLDIDIPGDFYENGISLGDAMLSFGAESYSPQGDFSKVLTLSKIRALGDILALLDPTIDRTKFAELDDSDLIWTPDIPISRESPYKYRVYRSFHPWREQQTVLGKLETAVAESLDVVDGLISGFDRKGIVYQATQEAWRGDVKPIPAVARLMVATSVETQPIALPYGNENQ